MWQFMDNHPAFVIVFTAGAFVLLVGLVFLIVKGWKSGTKIKRAKLFGNELEFNEESKEIPKTETEVMRDTLILCNSISQWQKQVDKLIESKTKEVIYTCIRFANTRIDNIINMAKLDYGSFLKEEKDVLTQEDNYQIIICGFLMDQTREDLKDIICTLIREDHFEQKSQSEIESIGDNATVRARIIFENHANVLNRQILKKVQEKNLPKIKIEANEIIRITTDKYKSLKEEIQNIIETEEKQFKEVLKLKFPNISDEGIKNIVNYYN